MLTADTITDEQIRELRESVAEIEASGPDRCSWGRCVLRGKHPRMDCMSGHYCTEHAMRIESEQLAAGQTSSFPSISPEDEEIFELCCLALFGAPYRDVEQAAARARCAEILNARMREDKGNP